MRQRRDIVAYLSHLFIFEMTDAGVYTYRRLQIWQLQWITATIWLEWDIFCSEAWLTQTICTNTLARLSPPILTLAHTVKTFVSQQDGVCYLALALLRNSPEKWQKELKVSSLPQNTPDPNLIDLHEMCLKNCDPRNAVGMSGVHLSVTMSRRS